MGWELRTGHISNRGALDGAPVTGPSNTVLPVISGTPSVGSTLTTNNGTWIGSGISYTYQWKRGGISIGGATSNSYLLVRADAGATITVQVTATNVGGSSSVVSAGIVINILTQIISASRAGLGSAAIGLAANKTQVISNVGCVNG